MTTAVQGFKDAFGFLGRIPQSNIGENGKLGPDDLAIMTTAVQGFEIYFGICIFASSSQSMDPWI